MNHTLEVGDILVTKTYFGSQAHVVYYRGIEGCVLIQVAGMLMKGHTELYVKDTDSFTSNRKLYRKSKHTPVQLQAIINDCGESVQ